MGIFSEVDLEQTQEQGAIKPFTLCENADKISSPESLNDEDRQQAKADTVTDALSVLNGTDTLPEVKADASAETMDDSEDQKRKEHEAQEAQRKAEWEAKQAAKKGAEQKAVQEALAMTDDAVMDASVKKLGLDAERLTRRNMKMCVTEHVQTLCLDNPKFARKAMHPRKSMISCFKYINRQAQEYLKQEMEDNGEEMVGYAMGGDVPDNLCYKWAEDYFNDSDVAEDKEKEETFVSRPYYGKSSSKKKKEPAKKKEPQKPAAQPSPLGQIQLSLGA